MIYLLLRSSIIKIPNLFKTNKLQRSIFPDIITTYLMQNFMGVWFDNYDNNKGVLCLINRLWSITLWSYWPYEKYTCFPKNPVACPFYFDHLAYLYLVFKLFSGDLLQWPGVCTNLFQKKPWRGFGFKSRALSKSHKRHADWWNLEWKGKSGSRAASR